ncbi:hypothetical protein REPUB_Repub06bG0161000 [Reevesia pubescens]
MEIDPFFDQPSNAPSNPTLESSPAVENELLQRSQKKYKRNHLLEVITHVLNNEVEKQEVKSTASKMGKFDLKCGHSSAARSLIGTSLGANGGALSGTKLVSKPLLMSGMASEPKSKDKLAYEMASSLSISLSSIPLKPPDSIVSKEKETTSLEDNGSGTPELMEVSTVKHVELVALPFFHMHVDARGFSGSIWVLWNSVAGQVQVMNKSEHYITLLIDNNISPPWALTVVYASHVPTSRELFGQFLRHHNRFDETPWLLIGHAM